MRHKQIGSRFAFAPRVHCRIEVRRQDGRLIVRLAGRLGEPEVAALFDACTQTSELPLLELDDLVSADAVGLDALLRLSDRGVELVGLPEYMRLRLADIVRARDEQKRQRRG